MSTSQVVSSRPGASEPVGRIHRYTFIERVHHWLGSLTYVYCLITGLAFWSPYMYWLAAIVGGGPSARFWHPWFGLAFAGSMIWMFVMWDRDMRITDADRRWSKAMDRYIVNDDARVPPSGRFNYGQKLFFWLMFYGVILLVISGIGLWFVESIPWSLRWLRYTAVTVHVIAALATIGGFIIHVYMSTALVRGSFSAMVQGDVSTAWAKEHHRLWYEQVTGDRTDRRDLR
jgi:formate dehydrogenase subunit gamma